MQNFLQRKLFWVCPLLAFVPVLHGKREFMELWVKMNRDARFIYGKGKVHTQGISLGMIEGMSNKVWSCAFILLGRTVNYVWWKGL